MDGKPAELSTAGIDLEGGPIRLLAMPRLLGYVFNPISVYFCHRRDGALAALIYQVHNTFSERHSYLIAVAKPASGPVKQTCAKRFHVSPFLGMDMRYDFNVTPPSERVAVTVRGSDAGGDIIVATLSGAHAPLTDRQLAFFVTYPLDRQYAGIHWEALRLCSRPSRLAHPAPPRKPSPCRRPKRHGGRHELGRRLVGAVGRGAPAWCALRRLGDEALAPPPRRARAWRPHRDASVRPRERMPWPITGPVHVTCIGGGPCGGSAFMISDLPKSVRRLVDLTRRAA
jgi:hypothetical protein